MFDAAMPRMRVGGRVAVLGLMENYATPGLPSRPDRTFQLLNEILLKRLQVCGSLVLDQLHTESHAEFLKQMRTWIDEGTVQPIEHVSHGLEKAPEALQGIFAGSNLGKSIVKVAD